MADDADRADEINQKHQQQSIEKILKTEQPKLKPIGECYYCGEPFKKSEREIKLFCNGSHATFFEEEQNRNVRRR